MAKKWCEQNEQKDFKELNALKFPYIYI